MHGPEIDKMHKKMELPPEACHLAEMKDSFVVFLR